jgi:hypothetical protein
MPGSIGHCVRPPAIDFSSRVPATGALSLPDRRPEIEARVRRRPAGVAAFGRLAGCLQRPAAGGH